LASITASGVGSGLDVNNLVSQLVAAERGPQDDRLNTREVSTTTQISAMGSLKGALSAFKSAVDALKTSAGVIPRKVTSGDEDAFTATAEDTAATGHYDIEVVDLAKANQLASSPFVGGATSVVGTGTLTISTSAGAFAVVLDSTHNTLADIRDAINKASGNTIVDAALIRESGGSRLVLTARTTGAASSITVAANGGDGGLNQLVYDPAPAGTHNLSVVQAAQDAHITVAGFDHYSSSNSVEDAIDGVTLNLKAKSTAGAVSLDIAYDDAAALDSANKFVTAYNTMYAQIAKLRSYEASTQAAGPLLGDSMLRGVEDEIRRALTDPVKGATGAYTSLASIGIARQTDGTLKLDETRFKTALTADRSTLANIFSNSTDGIAVRLSSRIDKHLASSGDFAARDRTLQDSLTRIKDDRAALDARMESVQARYMAQFTALDTLLAQMQQTSKYLAAQLASMPTPSSG
jgi:flagellar hook-associated protein 2